MIAQHKVNTSLKVEIMAHSPNKFSGKVIQDSESWKKGEISHSFKSDDFEIVFDLNEYMRKAEILKTTVKYF